MADEYLLNADYVRFISTKNKQCVYKTAMFVKNQFP